MTNRTKVGVIGKNKQLSDAHAHVDEKVGREGTAKSYASTTLVVSVLLHLLFVVSGLYTATAYGLCLATAGMELLALCLRIEVAVVATGTYTGC